MRQKGKLTNWDPNKAFGFISPNNKGARLFIHKSAFSNRKRIPKVGDIITYAVSADNKGRACAIDATFTGERFVKRQVKQVSKLSLYLTLSFIITLAVGIVLSYIPSKVAVFYLVASMFCYVVYALDKSKAKKGTWRISESTLHLVSALGGWPGAVVAQQVLRHKSKKQSFRIKFWLTVCLNIIALHTVLDAGPQLFPFFY